MFNYLIFTEIIHLAVTLVIASLFIKKLGVIKSLLVSLAFGFFVDADHLIDHLLYLAMYSQPFSWYDFFSGIYFDISQKLYVPFHSIELIIILSIIAYYFAKHTSLVIKEYKVHLIFLLAGMSLAGHLIVDQITSQPKALTYFFIYRMATGFQL